MHAPRPRPSLVSFVRLLILTAGWSAVIASGFLAGVASGQGTPAGFSYIPGGSFTMGATSGDTDANAPSITVTLSPFFIQQTETTKAQWDDVRTWAVNNGYTDLATGGGKAADHPVQSVSWWDVVKWCNARSEKEGLTPVYTVSGTVMRTGTTEPVANWSANGYRLPTEAEWEKAARGGVEGKRFPLGTDTISHAQANYRVYSSNGTTNFYSYDVEPRPPATGTDYYHPSYNDGVFPYASPVGSFGANGYGLYDMSGNVREWCWDWYGASYYTTSNGTTDPRGPASGSDRMFRGGGWSSRAIHARCADRQHRGTPGYTDYIGGFRPARSVIVDDMAYIPGGSFTMGATSGDTDANAPSITVTLSPFFIQQTETTKAQWDEVRSWAVNNGYTDLATGGGKAADHPVQSVSWWDVVKWCNARSEKEGLTPVYTVSGAVMRTGTTQPVANWGANGYRLPTEAEWEKAARGGVEGKRFPWGTDTISHEEANFQNNGGEAYATGTAGYHPSYTAGGTPYSSPVGSFGANGYGLYDMAGNIWEWCWDWYGSSYYTTSNGTTDPQGPASGSNRVRRGGGWAWRAIGARCALRDPYSPGATYGDLGFRPARTHLIGGMSYIPGGSFTMGRTSGDTDADAPPITVTVSPFYIQQTETTKAQWDEVRSWALNNGYTDLAVGAGKAANHPVQMVTWWDVVKWCNARSEKEGLTPVYTVGGAVMRTGTTEPIPSWSANGYRLPTEAEWEKAARGGISGKRYPWGTDTISHAEANYNGSGTDYGSQSSGYHPSYTAGSQPYTSPAGSFGANGYGLYDMSGNVWEWCWDWYGDSYYATSNGMTDPLGPVSGTVRVGRGGGWYLYALNARCGNRDRIPPEQPNGYFGFRPARSSILATPVITTPTATSLTATGATLGGNVTSDGGAAITERGIVFSASSTNPNPLIGGSGVTKLTTTGTTGAFTVPVTSLTPATGYSYKAYATNSAGTSYTDVATFSTLALPPTVTTPTASNLTATGATLGGNVTSDGGATITERGIVYSATATGTNPLIGGSGVTRLTTTGTTGVFTLPVTGLTPGTSYHFKAYAINSAGTTYTSVSSFLTTSNNANLSGLVLDGFSLSPSFNGATTVYMATVQRADGSVRIRPSAAHAGASLFARVNGGGWVAVGSGALSLPLVLEFGENLVEVRVIAQDGATEKTYTLEVFRNDPKPDASVGQSLAFMGGADVYDSALAQQLKLISRKANPVSGYVRAANRGNVADRIALQGSGGSRFFGVGYRDSGGALVTAAVRAGLHRTGEQAPGDAGDWVQVDVKPVKKLLVVKKGKRTVTLRKVQTLLIQASSLLDPSIGDGVSIRVETR